MSTSLKKKELIMKRLKAEAAKAELEFKIEERRNDIKRMEGHIQLQIEQIEKIDKELGLLEGEINGGL